MDVTAVVLSSKPVDLVLPGLTVLGHVSSFDDAAGLLAARYAAISRVTTGHFFFLDDDDELPADYLRVVGLCLDARVPLAYTNERVILDGVETVRLSQPFCQFLATTDVALIHHLALCETAAAQALVPKLPTGAYGFEPLFYTELAKQGSKWIDEIGYVWKRRPDSLSRQPDIARSMCTSATWAFRNRHVR